MSGENTNTKPRSRFDLEQEILECWKVTEDITMFVDQDSDLDDFKVLASYYEKKFNRLWSTFEQLVEKGKL